MPSKRDAWLSLVPGDPRPALLASDEPFARFVALTAVLGMAEDEAEVLRTRQAVVADPRVRALVGRLPVWESGFAFSGHNSPAFPPNLLRLLHGMGVRGGDFPAIERMLDAMLRHQADDGRYLTPGGTTGKTPSAWASLPCDHFAILLSEHVDARGLGDVVSAPVEVVLDADRHLVLQPDICFVAVSRCGMIRGRVWGAPDLVVEVLSCGSRTYDRHRKLGWYRRYGVREYWMVDPIAREIAVNDLVSDTRRAFGARESVRTRVLPRLKLEVGRIFP